MNLACAALLLSCLAAAVGTARADTIKVGILNQDTGPFALQGQDFRRGVETYIAQHGDKAGDDTVQVVFADVGGANPAAARRLAEELVVRDGVSVLGGFYLTSDALGAVDVVNKANVPAVLFVAASPSLLTKSKNFVRAGQQIGQSAIAAAQFALKQGKRKAYIAVADYAPGYDVQHFFRKAFEAGGGEIVGEDRIPLNTVDFAAFAERIQNANPEVVDVFVPPGAPAVNFTNALSAVGLMKKAIIIGMGEAEDAQLKLFDDKLVGFYQSLYYGEAVDNPENKAFQKAYADKYGANARPSFAAVSAYDGMAEIYRMIAAQKGKFSTPVALDALKGYAWASPRGPMKIDPDTREVVQNIYIRKVVEQDGALKNVVVDAFDGVKAPSP